MRLTFDRGSGAYVLDGLQPADIDRLRVDHGLATSAPAWPRQPAVTTRSPYAALAFHRFADGEAVRALSRLKDQYEESRALTAPGGYACPSGREYFPFQNAFLRYALGRNATLSGDEMGVGKTVEGLGLANEMQAKRVLVVCPAALRPHWREKIAGTPGELPWSVIPRVRVYPVMKSADGVDPHAHYTIVSYELLSSPGIFQALMKLKWDLIILDECHLLKTIDTRRTRAVFGKLDEIVPHLAENAAYTLGLTGTPLPNRPRECYTIARHLCHEAIDWLSEDAFKRRYNPSMTMPSGRVVEQAGHLPELRARLRCNFMIRRLASDVMPQLPKSSYELTYLEPNGEIRKALHAESLMKIDPTHLENIDPKLIGHVALIRHQMGLAKVPRVIEYVKTIMSSTQKLAVAFYHRDVGQNLFKGLSEFDPVIVLGGLGSSEVNYRKDQFIANPGKRLFLAQLEVGGVGLDGMQKVCHIAAYAEASWVPKDNDQFLGRFRRHGQTRSVLGQLLVAEGGWDEKVLHTNHKKAKNVHATLDGE